MGPQNTLKKILRLNQLGITVYCENGCRWIAWPDEYHCPSLEAQELLEKLKKNNGTLREKIHGNLVDVLNYIDKVMLSLGFLPLLEQYNREFSADPWGFLTEGKLEHTWESKGREQVKERK